MAEVVSFAYAKLVERGGKPAPRNGANVPPQCFAPAGTSARKGEGARELLPVQTAEHVAPKTVPRSSLVSHDAVITLTFPGEEQPFHSAAPPGMKAPLYPFTPVVADAAASASGGGRAAQRLQAQADRGAVTNAVRVAAKAWRHSPTGDAESGTPPFAQITVSPPSPMHPPRVGCHHHCRPSIRRKGSGLESRLHHLSGAPLSFRGAQEGGKDGQKRLDFWVSAVMDGSIADARWLGLQGDTAPADAPEVGEGLGGGCAASSSGLWGATAGDFVASEPSGWRCWRHRGADAPGAGELTPASIASVHCAPAAG